MKQAGKDLHNCLGQYCKKIVIHYTVVIGLVYEKHDDKRKLVGAVEIVANKLLQAKTFCNASIIHGDMKDYIMEYAKRKNINWIN